MKQTTLKIFSFAAGFFLIISGITFYLWIPAGSTTQEQAAYLLNHKAENIIFIFSVLLSNILIAPVILYLMILLYKRHPAAALSAGAFYALAVILESIAVLISLSLWTNAIPDAASGDNPGIKLFETVQTIYLAVDFPGVIMFYIAGAILGIIFRNIYKPAFLIFTGSLILFLAGGILMQYSSALSNFLSALSICIYGTAYFSFIPLIKNLEENI